MFFPKGFLHGIVVFDERVFVWIVAAELFLSVIVQGVVEAIEALVRLTIRVCPIEEPVTKLIGDQLLEGVVFVLCLDIPHQLLTRWCFQTQVSDGLLDRVVHPL